MGDYSFAYVVLWVEQGLEHILVRNLIDEKEEDGNSIKNKMKPKCY